MALRRVAQALQIQMRRPLTPGEVEVSRQARLHRLTQNLRAQHNLMRGDPVDGDRHRQIGQRPGPGFG